MGIFSFLSKKSGGTKILNSADLADLFSGSESTAGVTVSQSSAIQFSTVWACVRLLAECIAQLPIHVYVKNRDGSKTRVTDTALADLLTAKPNFWQTPFEYTEFMVTALAMRGNHYAHISRFQSGQIIEIIPFSPASVTAKRNGLRDITYEVLQFDGSIVTYGPEEISHVRGMSLNGFDGISPIGYHRETIGLAMAAEKYGARLFKNGARPSGIIRHPQTLSQEAYTRLKKYWQSMYGGSNIGKTAILEEGSEYQAVSMSNEDAQYLDVRQFQRTEICSIYRIPPHMIGDLTKSSFSNITQQSLEFVKYTILPWCRRIESAMYRDLLSPKERRQGMFVQYLVDGLERADIKTRYEAYRTGIFGGFLSPNEVRQKENMNGRPGGDIYLAPLNMVDSSDGMTKPVKAAVPSYRIKGVMAREQLRLKFKSRFAKIGAMVVEYEAGLVRLALGEQTIQEALDAVYAQLPPYIEKSFKSLMREYAAAVRSAALKDAAADDDVDMDLAGFVDDLLAGLSMRHVASSVGQLSALIRDTDPENLAEAIELRLDEWVDKRPAKIAENETVQQESATSRFVWAAAGITRLQWVRRGNKSCPFCTDLDGKIVGIQAPFVERGNYEPEGSAGSPWKIRGPKMHAPIHQGCQCVIIPVQG